MKCMICLSLAAVSSLPSTISFSTTSTRTSSQTTRTATSTKLYSSTKQDSSSSGSSSGGWSIGSPSRKMEEAQHKKEIAKEALCKLLDRQQKEMQQTLDLIEDLEIDYEEFIQKQQLEIEKQIFDSNFNISSLEEGVDEAPSITASIASGFNYGYISRSEGCRYESINQEYVQDERFVDYGPPGNVFSLGSQQFMRNLRAMIGEYKDENDNPKLTDKQRELQSKLQELTLSSDAIWDRERARGEIVAPLIIKIPYFALCYLLDVVFEGRNAFSRFFLLETVARMPYFSYITMLHLYETLGFWRRSADIKVSSYTERTC